jgi:hypothetical protein
LRLLNSIAKTKDGENVLLEKISQCNSTTLSFIYNNEDIKIEGFVYALYPPPIHDAKVSFFQVFPQANIKNTGKVQFFMRYVDNFDNISQSNMDMLSSSYGVINYCGANWLQGYVILMIMVRVLLMIMEMTTMQYV